METLKVTGTCNVQTAAGDTLPIYRDCDHAHASQYADPCGGDAGKVQEVLNEASRQLESVIDQAPEKVAGAVQQVAPSPLPPYIVP